nr:hypothetical protein [Tanacetum cinerariifolium]
MAMLSMRVKRFLQRTGSNLGANGTTFIGFDMSKVECYNCYRRGHFARECRSPKDTKNKDTQRRNVPADEELTNYALMAFTSSSYSSSDNKVAPCFKACSKAYATLKSHYDKLTNDLKKSQFDVLSYKSGLESIEARLVVYQQNENVFEDDIKLLKPDVMLRDNDLVDLRKKFKKAKQERDELKLKLETFQTSSKNLSKLLASQITDKIGLGYDNQVFNSTMFDCDELISSESDVSMPTSLVHDRYKSGEGYHAVPPPYTGTFKPSKPDLIFYDALTTNEIVPTVLNVKHSTTKHNIDLSQLNRPSAPIIEDWVSDSEDESKGEPMPTQKAPSFVQTSKHVKTPRPSVKPVKHLIPAENLRKDIPKSRGHRHSWNKKACFVCKKINGGYVAFGGNPKGGKITGKGKIRTSKLDFDDVYFVKEIKFNLFSVSQMCDKNNSVLFTDTECIVLSSDFKLPDDNHAEAVNTACYVQNRILVTKPHTKTPYELLLGRIPSIGFMRPFGYPVTILNTLDPLGKFDGKADEGFLVRYSINSKAFIVFSIRTRIIQETLNINFLENQPNVAGSGPTWLFDIDTLTRSMNYHPVVTGNQPNSSAGIQENLTAGTNGKEAEIVQQYMLLPLWSSGSKVPQTTDAFAFEVKEPESAVHVSPSSCDKRKKHDDKTKREAKGKSLVELYTGVRDLSDDFEEFSNNSTNGVNAASTSVTAVEPNSTNSTNTFSVVGPFNNVVSSNFELGGKSSHVDHSQYLDDPDMLALKDITYLDDEEDVSAEADFSNLETNITVSPIPTSRVHKDHPVTQIIGDLSSAPQTRNMTRMVKEQGGLTQINDEDCNTPKLGRSG